MLSYVLLAAYCTAGVAYLWVALSAQRRSSRDTRGFLGHRLPDHVREDDTLRRRAHELITFWCFGAGVLSLAPVLPLYRVADDGDLDMTALVILAGYTLVVSTVGRYPFEKIKKLAPEES